VVLGWVAATLTSAVVLIVCWYAVSGDYSFDDQKTALDLAIVAVVVTNLAGAAALISGRRAVALRRRQMLADMPTRSLRSASPGPEALDGTAPVALIAGAGLTRYHRSTCQLAAGRDWPEASRASHELDGRTPCGACRP
jgi:hypothetical protein